MATIVKYGTQKGEGLIQDMNRKYYKGETLYDCYKSVSSKKVQTWEKIKRECEALHGRRLHITGAGSHFYSCIYAYPITDDEGVITDMVIRKETAGNTYEMTMPVDDYEKRIIHREG